MYIRSIQSKVEEIKIAITNVQILGRRNLGPRNLNLSLWDVSSGLTSFSAPIGFANNDLFATSILQQ